MRDYPVKTFLAELFAAEPPPGPYDPARYGKSFGGLINSLREVVLPSYLPAYQDAPDAVARRRNGLRWWAACGILEILTLVAILFEGSARVLVTVAAIACWGMGVKTFRDILVVRPLPSVASYDTSTWIDDARPGDRDA